MSEIRVKDFETLDALFKHTGKGLAKIYAGLDRNCRCGCGGKYYYAGSKQFNSMINRAKKAFIETKNYIENYCEEVGKSGLSCFDRELIQSFVYNPEIYVNIPRLTGNNKCYCIYFLDDDDENND